MSDIPTEVRFDILCRLPVKSLLKFRCVSKSWKALIDSPTFVKMHLQSSGINPKLILCGLSSWCSLDILETPTHPESTMVTLDYPFKDKEHPTFVLGHCDGLLLVECGSDFVLWNPSTHKYVRLPNYKFKLPTKRVFDVQFYFGIGYDKITDDYKVLRIQQAIGNNKILSSLAVVYSLKSHSYKKINQFPFRTDQVAGGVFVSGALHWLVADEYTIVAFDLGSEEYNKMHLPKNFGKVELKRAVLGVFEGCLSLSCNCECKRVDIWLLRDPKNRDSWAKLCSLEVSIQDKVKAISYSKCGKHIILEKNEEQILCYDLESKSVRKIQLVDGLLGFSNYLFSESLVLNNIGGAEVSKLIVQPEENLKKTKKSDGFLSTGFKLKL